MDAATTPEWQEQQQEQDAHIQGDSPMRAFCVQRVCTAPLSGSSVSWLLLRLHSSDVFFASIV